MNCKKGKRFRNGAAYWALWGGGDGGWFHHKEVTRQQGASNDTKKKRGNSTSVSGGLQYRDSLKQKIGCASKEKKHCFGVKARSKLKGKAVKNKSNGWRIGEFPGVEGSKRGLVLQIWIEAWAMIWIKRIMVWSSKKYLFGRRKSIESARSSSIIVWVGGGESGLTASSETEGDCRGNFRRKIKGVFAGVAETLGEAKAPKNPPPPPPEGSWVFQKNMHRLPAPKKRRRETKVCWSLQ